MENGRIVHAEGENNREVVFNERRATRRGDKRRRKDESRLILRSLEASREQNCPFSLP